MDKVGTHLLLKEAVAERLRRRRLSVRSISFIKGYDLLVNGHLRVSLRVALPVLRKHTVTVRGKRYTYHYSSWHFNFHHHGRRGRKFTDVFVCVPLEYGNGPQSYFVIPWVEVTGLTFTLHQSARLYDGQYARNIDNWRAISKMAAYTPGHVA